MTTDVAHQDWEALKARVRDLEVALKQNDTSLMLAFNLTPAAGNLFGLLLSARVVTADTIQQGLEIATDAKVAIHRLRQQLKPWDITIHSRRGLGYWIDAETKARAKALMAQPEPQLVTTGGEAGESDEQPAQVAA